MAGFGWSPNADRTGPIWSWFDVQRYGRYDALAFVAARSGEAAAIEDYRDRGEAAGFAPNALFDPVFYKSANPDIGAGEYRSAFDHYCDSGWRDCRPHWLFDTALYRSQNLDLVPDAVDGLGGLYGHYLNSGAHEGRIAHRLFDPLWYAAHAGEDAAMAPFQHYLAQLDTSARSGAPEPLASLYFDPVWYLATYPEVARAIAAGRYLGALHHYLVAGMAAGHDPLCDFSEADYDASSPDRSEAEDEPFYVNGYDHFLAEGAAALRSPCNHVDLAWYASQPDVAQDLATGRYPHAFAHLVAVGVPTGCLC